MLLDINYAIDRPADDPIEPVPQLGMGCWAIGGPFFADGKPLGYAEVNDNESLAALEAALEHGIRFFDTAAVYGTGHSERLLGRVLNGRDDVVVCTKIGFAFDSECRQVHGPSLDPEAVDAAVDACRSRLRRDRIDIVLLHLNDLSVAEAEPVFDHLATLRDRGWIGSVGWSTDFPDRVQAMASRGGFRVIEHACNVFFSAPRLLPVIEENTLLSLVRSPLAMGVLSGKFASGHRLTAGDVRANDLPWIAWFSGGEVSPHYRATLEAIRDCLECDGRTAVQGALGWLYAHAPHAMPIPGFRTAAQVRENAAALAFGPLPPQAMQTIEALIDRGDEEELKAR